MKFKSRLISVIALLSLIIGTVPGASYAAVYRDPYEIIYANSLDGATQSGYNNRESFLGSMTNGAGYYYEGVDFGKVAPTYVEVGIGVPDNYAGSVFQLLADSPDGDVLAEFTALSSGDFGTSVVRRYEIKKKITGIHTLYLKKLTGSPTNVYTFQFFAPLTGQDSYEDYKDIGVFSDISESKYKKEINALSGMGVIQSSGEFYPLMYVTGADFAVMLYNMLNVTWYDDTAKRFADMPDEANVNEAVNYLTDRGIIQSGDKSFSPSGFVNTSDALKMLCRALGYGVVSEKYGDSSYLKLAAEKGLTDGFSASGKLRNEEAAKLLYNAAVSEYFSYSTSTDNGRFDYSDRDILITKTKGYKKEEGVVEATNNTSLTSPDPGMTFDHVRIDKELYNVGDTNAKSLLGYECEFFYSEDSGEKRLIFISPKSSVSVTDISSKDYDITGISAGEVTYSDDKKAKTIKLQKDTAIIYNGAAIDESLGSLIEKLPLSGSIRYIENPKSSNVLFINEYTDIIISSLDFDNGVITDDITDNDISYDSENDFVYCMRFGEAVRLKDMKSGDVAMMYESKNKTGGKIIRFVIGGGRSEGIISQYDSDYITIENKKYKRAASFNDDIKPGGNAEFYVNAADEIVRIEYIAGVDNIGLFLGAFINDDDEKLYIKVYTTDNKQEMLPCAEKVFVDGVRASSYTDGKRLFDECGSEIDKTPIRYSIFKKSVSMVDTYKDGKSGINDTLVRRKLDGEYQYENSNRVLVNKSNGRVDGIFADNGKFLSVWGDESDIKNYIFSGVTGKTETLKGDLYSYDRNGNYVDLFVIKSRSDDYDRPIIFHELKTYVDDNDEISLKLIGFSAAGRVEYTIPEEDTASGDLSIVRYLEEDEWIRISPKQNGEINSIELLYSPKGKTSKDYYSLSGTKYTASYRISDEAYYSGSNNQDTRFVTGTVSDKFGNYIEVTHKDGASEFLSCANVSVVKLSDKGDEPTTGLNTASIKKGDKIAAYISFRKTLELIIIN